MSDFAFHINRNEVVRIIDRQDEYFIIDNGSKYSLIALSDFHKEYRYTPNKSLYDEKFIRLKQRLKLKDLYIKFDNELSDDEHQFVLDYGYVATPIKNFYIIDLELHHTNHCLHNKVCCAIYNLDDEITFEYDKRRTIVKSYSKSVTNSIEILKCFGYICTNNNESDRPSKLHFVRHFNISK